MESLVPNEPADAPERGGGTQSNRFETGTGRARNGDGTIHGGTHGGGDVDCIRAGVGECLSG